MPQVKSCGMSAQEKLNLYHTSTDETQGSRNEGVSTVKCASGEIREK